MSVAGTVKAAEPVTVGFRKAETGQVLYAEHLLHLIVNALVFLHQFVGKQIAASLLIVKGNQFAVVLGLTRVFVRAAG